MKKIVLSGFLLAMFAPVWVAGQLVFESAPNLAIPDGSCLDPDDGRGEGGVVDSIAIPQWVPPIFGMRVEVEIDHRWRSDLQVAVGAAGLPDASVAEGMRALVSLGAAASATPRLANAHAPNSFTAENYYATFDDFGGVPCSHPTACGSPGHCSAADEDMVCRPDEPIMNLLTASATPRVVQLRLCDRDGGFAGTLRRWRLFVASFIPVELQSFSVE